MKILKLRFKNIHSFKGVHEVDFTVVPLSQAGLFAITGATGAGKSTILDVITLALYNRIPRFDGAISTNEIQNLGSVMTHFTDDAYAEVEYQVYEASYRSTWRISKTRNNTFRDYEMTLASISDGVIIEGKKSEVPAINTRYIGLNYEQFVRSIILSQGEFAKFLKADKTERTSLLEEITGSKIYRSLGKAAFEKAKSKREDIQQLKMQKDAIPLYTEEQVLEKSQQIEANNILITKREQEIVQAKQQLALVEKKLQIVKKLTEAKSAFSILSDRKKTFEAKAERLKKHQNLDIYRNEIALWQNDHHLYEDKLKEIERCKFTISQQENLLFVAIQEMKAFTRTDVNEDNFLEKMKKFEYQIIELDNELRSITEKGISTRAELNELLQNPNFIRYSSQIQEVSDLSVRLDICRTMLSTLTTRKQYLETDEALRLQSQEIGLNISKMEKLFASAQILEKEEVAITQLETDLKNISINKNEIEIQLAIHQANEAKLLPEIEALQKKKEAQFKISSLDEQRKLLKDNEPCPLCGSTHHPFAEEHVYTEIGKTEAQILTLNQQLESARKEILSCTTRYSALKTQIEATEKEIVTKKDIIVNVLAQYPELKQPESEAAFIRNSIEKLEIDRIQLNNEMEARVATNFFTLCQQKIENLEGVTQKYMEINGLRQSLYIGKDINGDADKIQNKYISARDLSKEWKGTLNNLENNVTKLSNSIKERGENLLLSLSPLGYQDVGGALEDILDDEVLKSILAEKEIITNEETELSTVIKTLTTENNDIQLPDSTGLNVDELKTSIQEMETNKNYLIHTNGALEKELEQYQEAKKLIKEAEKLLTQKSKDAEVWYIMEKLIGDASGNKYARYAQNLSLKHLIDLANKRLTKLTDRYQLVHSDIENDLTISDLYQGSVNRSVKTLSGGESFIVSLALALSLSDMASQNVKLESLFIDEGFGTLDAETLEIAIGTLEKLQSESDRMIGIISHVDSLKERISTQIKVIKNISGHAAIELVG